MSTENGKKACPNCGVETEGETCQWCGGSTDEGETRRLSEVEVLKIRLLDEELVRRLLEVKEIDRRLIDLEQQWFQRKNEINLERLNTLSRVEAIKREGKQLVAEIAGHWGYDPEQMSFDLDTRIVHDTRKAEEQVKTEGPAGDASPPTSN